MLETAERGESEKYRDERFILKALGDGLFIEFVFFFGTLGRIEIGISWNQKRYLLSGSLYQQRYLSSKAVNPTAVSTLRLPSPSVPCPVQLPT
jgi:hypothetical protein